VRMRPGTLLATVFPLLRCSGAFPACLLVVLMVEKVRFYIFRCGGREEGRGGDLKIDLAFPRCSRALLRSLFLSFHRFPVPLLICFLNAKQLLRCSSMIRALISLPSSPPGDSLSTR